MSGRLQARLATVDGPLIGGWISIGAEPVVETMAGLGYDYLGLDTQHTLIDVAAAARLLHAAPQEAPPVLVRVPSNNAADIGRALDGGADGVIVPMVNTAAEAAAAVAACRYAPAGVRSYGPFRSGLPSTPADLEARVACLVMIETAEAVANAEAICATPGLTGIYIGPADLAVSLGMRIGADPMPTPLREAVERVARACRDAGVVAGGHFPAMHAPLLSGLGLRMLTIGSDRGYMGAAARADLAATRKAIAPA